MVTKRLWLLAVAIQVVALALPVVAGATVPGQNELISSDVNGTPANKGSYQSSTSADGRYVAFYSNATNLVAEDTNNKPDIFVKDRHTGAVERVSVATDGTQSNGDIFNGPSISADGRYVAFNSTATTLVPGATQGYSQIYLRDRTIGQTTLVSQTNEGTPGSWYSYSPNLSADGRYVTYYSDAANLVPDDTNEASDIFVRDLSAGTTRRASVSESGVQANAGSYNPSLSSDGQYVAYNTFARNLQDGVTVTNAWHIVFKDLGTGQTHYITANANATYGGGGPVFSADGNSIVFQLGPSNLIPSSPNSVIQTMVYDRAGGQISYVSVNSNGDQGNANSTDTAHISADGRYIAYISQASNLVAGDTNNRSDAFLYNRQTGVTELLTKTSTGVISNGDTINLSMSADGKFVALMTNATNLVPRNPTNDWDVVGALTGALPAKLDTPTGLSAASPTTNAPVLTWNSVVGATSYQVWRYDTLSGANQLVSNNLADTNFTDTYLPGVYNYTVVALGSNGLISDPSASIQVAVINNSTPTARNLKAQGNTRVAPDNTDLLPTGGMGPKSASFDFDLGYPGETFKVKRELTLTYKVGNITELFVESTHIDWLAISGTDNATGTFQGVATVTQNGIVSFGLPFTVSATDSSRNGQPQDTLHIIVYADGTKSTKLVEITKPVVSGKIKIN